MVTGKQKVEVSRWGLVLVLGWLVPPEVLVSITQIDLFPLSIKLDKMQDACQSCWCWCSTDAGSVESNMAQYMDG